MSTTTRERTVGPEPGETALLIAHPGHELLLHHWVERTSPVVFALTDGSGGQGAGRRERSARVIRAAGGRVGEVFGPAPDRQWYAAVLDGDRHPFEETADRIAAECVDRGITVLVSDSVEYFNPMHDLAAALARRIVRRIRAASGNDVELFDFPVERPELRREPPASTVHLDAAALERKRAAALSFAELEAEVKRHAAALEAHATERLYRVSGDAGWPECPGTEPFYEVFGRERVTAGQYPRLITYRDHVRPLVVALGAAS